MSDENSKVYFMTVRKSIEEIRFCVLELEGIKPKCFYIPERGYPKDWLPVIFYKPGAKVNFPEYSLSRRMEIDGARIVFQQIGSQGCRAQLVCTSKELDMIQDDFLVLRDALGLEGWQDDHAEKPSEKHKSNRGRRPNLKIAEQERLCKLYDSVREDTTQEDFCKPHDIALKTFQDYWTQYKIRHNISD